jgi:hypothetical protein
LIVVLSEARRARVEKDRSRRWTSDELELRLRFGLAGAPGTFDPQCAALPFLDAPTRAAALELLLERRRACEDFILDISDRYDRYGWHHLVEEPDVAAAIESAERTIAAARRILADEDRREVA